MTAVALVALGVLVVLVAAVVATRPEGVALGRYSARLAGQVVLDAFRGAVRVAVQAVVVLALVWALWAGVVWPQVSARLDELSARLERAQSAVTSAVPHPSIPDVSIPDVWDRLTQNRK